ncbi:hypothetical protein BJV82DRAFT_673380 [Fennellomyces sp. T-0311]|nr:hypothetical protein BJV82DRAFT_673380 [Fennellomyces sp. T-0311]
MAPSKRRGIKHRPKRNELRHQPPSLEQPQPQEQQQQQQQQQANGELQVGDSAVIPQARTLLSSAEDGSRSPLRKWARLDETVDHVIWGYQEDISDNITECQGGMATTNVLVPTGPSREIENDGRNIEADATIDYKFRRQYGSRHHDLTSKPQEDEYRRKVNKMLKNWEDILPSLQKTYIECFVNGGPEFGDCKPAEVTDGCCCDNQSSDHFYLINNGRHKTNYVLQVPSRAFGSIT